MLNQDNWKEVLRTKIDGVNEYEDMVKFIEDLLSFVEERHNDDLLELNEKLNA